MGLHVSDTVDRAISPGICQMKRPKAHTKGALGVAGLTKACLECEWACDPVLSDYGEDLIVQTTLNEEVDTFRTLFQVKCTEKIRARGSSFKWRIRREHALRWHRSREPVVLVIWELASGTGWFALPREQTSEFALLTSSRRTVSVLFEKSSCITRQKLEQLAWRLRLKHYEERMVVAHDADMTRLEFGQKKSPDGTGFQSSLAVIAFDLLHTIGIMRRGKLAPVVLSRFANLRRLIASRDQALPVDERATPEHLDDMAATLFVIAQIQEVASTATPTALSTLAAHYLLLFIKQRKGRNSV
ncbi:DUF4365 domain-containing protein [Sorangium sp. So ce204]|uniref:DUF4365 domain-containing protein n=1 Tax=Sorangium sp. So ce204 TaxID=3133288 RepID=UPI003F5D7EF8